MPKAFIFIGLVLSTLLLSPVTEASMWSCRAKAAGNTPLTPEALAGINLAQFMNLYHKAYTAFPNRPELAKAKIVQGERQLGNGTSHRILLVLPTRNSTFFQKYVYDFIKEQWLNVDDVRGPAFNFPRGSDTFYFALSDGRMLVFRKEEEPGYYRTSVMAGPALVNPLLFSANTTTGFSKRQFVEHFKDALINSIGKSQGLLDQLIAEDTVVSKAFMNGTELVVIYAEVPFPYLSAYFNKRARLFDPKTGLEVNVDQFPEGTLVSTPNHKRFSVATDPENPIGPLILM